MMMALAGDARSARACWCRAASRCWPRKARTRARCSRSARASRTGRSRWKKPRRLGCRACASPGGGCQFLGTAATSQVVGEALGMSLPHSALAPSGQPIWLDMARRSARAALALEARGLRMRDILTDAALRNAMVVHAAFGGSTNLILHLPAIALSAGLPRPTVDDWTARQPPGAAPGGRAAQRPAGTPDRAGLPGRRRARGDAAPAPRRTAGNRTRSRPAARRSAPCSTGGSSPSAAPACARTLRERDGIDPDDVIMDPDGARARGLTSTVTFPAGNLAPGGSVIKSTAIDPAWWTPTASTARRGRRASSRTETDAIAAIKRRAAIQAGRRAGADLPRADGLRHGGDLPDHRRR